MSEVKQPISYTEPDETEHHCDACTECEYCCEAICLDREDSIEGCHPECYKESLKQE